MKASFLALALGAALLSGCAGSEAPNYAKEMEQSGPGMFGDLRWNIDLKTGKWERVGQLEGDEFQKWRDSASESERKEFEEWRAWQEWKRNNPK